MFSKLPEELISVFTMLVSNLLAFLFSTNWNRLTFRFTCQTKTEFLLEILGYLIPQLLNFLTFKTQNQQLISTVAEALARVVWTGTSMQLCGRVDRDGSDQTSESPLLLRLLLLSFVIRQLELFSQGSNPQQPCCDINHRLHQTRTQTTLIEQLLLLWCLF